MSVGPTQLSHFIGECKGLLLVSGLTAIVEEMWNDFQKIIKRWAIPVGLLVTTSGCSSVFYQPLKPLVYDPASFGLSYESKDFLASDGTHLKGWFFPAKLKTGQKLKGTVIQFHGNAENRSTHFMSYVWVVEQGYQFFTFDYRGYADSEGIPDQFGTIRDAKGAIEFALKSFPRAQETKDVVLVGQSLGGAILLRALPEVKDHSRLRLVVIDSSFYSYQAIATDMLSRPWLTWPFQWLGKAWISDQYSPEDFISEVSPVPLLVIHGDRDRVIPIRFGEEIFRRAQEPKTFWKVEGGTHIDSMVNPAHSATYRSRLLQFLEKL